MGPILKPFPRRVTNLHSFSFEVFDKLITMATSELAPPLPLVPENAPAQGMFKKLNFQDYFLHYPEMPFLLEVVNLLNGYQSLHFSLF